MHTEWCPAGAIRSIRHSIFHGSRCGGRGGASGICTHCGKCTESGCRHGPSGSSGISPPTNSKDLFFLWAAAACRSPNIRGRASRDEAYPLRMPFFWVGVRSLISWTGFWPLAHEATWSYMKLHEATWSYLKLHEAAWSYMKLHEATWSYVKLHEATWSYMKLHEATWS